MKKIALSKVAKIDRTVATDDECLNLPYVGLENVEKESGQFAADFVPTPLNMLATNFRFTPKHVLYGKLRPYLNKVVLPNFDGVCTTEILPILPNEEKLDRTFLWAILLSPTFVDWATSQISGANLPRLDPKLLAEYEIPLPPLTEQKRIASLLARADRLRTLRRTAHELGESLLQSVFLEMFEKARGKMKEVRLETLAEVKTGGTPSREVPEYFDGQIPWVKTMEVVNEVIYDTSEKISEAGLKASNCEVFPVDTILLAMYGQGLTRGRTGKLAIPATTNQACAAILPSSKINTDYLWTFLKLSYNDIQYFTKARNWRSLTPNLRQRAQTTRGFRDLLIFEIWVVVEISQI